MGIIGCRVYVYISMATYRGAKEQIAGCPNVYPFKVPNIMRPLYIRAPRFKTDRDFDNPVLNLDPDLGLSKLALNPKP